MSDFVKFAKYQPGISDNEHDFRVIRNSVELLNKIGEENKAVEEGIPPEIITAGLIRQQG